MECIAGLPYSLVSQLHPTCLTFVSNLIVKGKGYCDALLGLRYSFIGLTSVPCISSASPTCFSQAPRPGCCDALLGIRYSFPSPVSPTRLPRTGCCDTLGTPTRIKLPLVSHISRLSPICSPKSIGGGGLDLLKESKRILRN